MYINAARYSLTADNWVAYVFSVDLRLLIFLIEHVVCNENLWKYIFPEKREIDFSAGKLISMKTNRNQKNHLNSECSRSRKMLHQEGVIIF